MNAKRWTLCLLRGHKWNKIRYPATEEGDTGFFVRCARCGHENHDAGIGVRPTGAGM